ncbi:hypothetical protein HETIRDRAFT_144228, partial [Heterobasidion irregulare TC 32-1]
MFDVRTSEQPACPPWQPGNFEGACFNVVTAVEAPARPCQLRPVKSGYGVMAESGHRKTPRTLMAR